MTRLVCVLILGLCVCQGLYPPFAGGFSTPRQAGGFVEEFDGDWSARWDEVELAAPPTSYRVVDDQGDAILRAVSMGGAAALVRRLAIPADRRGRIAWRWRIAQSIVAARDASEKSGDDYSGRLFVLFDGDFGDSGARALCYVWAEHLPIGSTFPSPYIDRVAMVVVSGTEAHRDGWVSVERDYIRDYEEFFGDAPSLVTGVAIMVDTDDTGAAAGMLFDRVEMDAGRSVPR